MNITLTLVMLRPSISSLSLGFIANMVLFTFPFLLFLQSLSQTLITKAQQLNFKYFLGELRGMQRYLIIFGCMCTTQAFLALIFYSVRLKEKTGISNQDWETLSIFYLKFLIFIPN